MEHPDSFLKTLYETEYRTLIRAAYRMTGDIESAEDMVQETFGRALFHLDELSNHALPGGWLMVTLRYVVLNHQNKNARHPEVPLDSVTVSAKEPEMKLEMILPKQLSKADREILIWRYEWRMEYWEIADRLGISEAGCRSRVSRAVAHCRKLMERS